MRLGRGRERRESTRVPYTGVICCWRVKLFNPAGINHSRHVRNLCTPEPRQNARRTAPRLEIFAHALPERKDRSPRPSRRRLLGVALCPGVNSAGSDSEDQRERADTRHSLLCYSTISTELDIPRPRAFFFLFFPLVLFFQRMR